MTVPDVFLTGIACRRGAVEDPHGLWIQLMGEEALEGAVPVETDTLLADVLRDAELAPGTVGAPHVLVDARSSTLCAAATEVAAGRRGDCAAIVLPGSGLGFALESEAHAGARAARAWARIRPVSLSPEAPEAAGLLVLAAHTGEHDSDASSSAFRPALQVPPEPGLALAVAALAVTHKLLPALPADAERLRRWGADWFSNAEARPWIQHPSRGPRRALVVDAIEPNVGLLVEEVLPGAGLPVRPRPIRTGLTWPSELLRLGGSDLGDLLGQLEQLAQSLEAETASTDFAAFVRRWSEPAGEDASARLAIVATDAEDLAGKLALARARLADAQPVFQPREDVFHGAGPGRAHGKVACLFPGLSVPGLQGPYVDHLRELALRLPGVRADLDRVDRRDDHPDDPTPTSVILFPPSTLPSAQRAAHRHRWAIPTLSNVERQEGPGFSNLCHFGVTVANMVSWGLLRCLGVSADMLFGQSEGDASALAAAGALTFDEVLREHAAQRMQPDDIPFDCNLAIVNTDGDSLDEIVAAHPDITIAMYIAPHLQFVGGRPEHLADFVKGVRAKGVRAQVLPYPAVHTRAFTKIHAIVKAAVGRFDVRLPEVPVYSGITAERHPDDPALIRANLAHNIDKPVRLWESLRAMFRDGARVFVQLGDGGSMLHRYAMRAAPQDEVVGVSMDLDYRDPLTQLQSLCANLWTVGVPVDVSVLAEHRSWHDEASEGRATSDPLEPEEQPSDLPFVRRILRRDGDGRIEVECTLDLEEDRHLAHHLYIRTGGRKPESACLPILPLTFGVELMAEAASLLAPGRGLIGFEDVRARRWIQLRDTSELPLRVTATAHGGPDGGPLPIRVEVFLPGQDEPALEGTVLFDVAYRAEVAFRPSALEGAAPHPHDAETIYARRDLWHGPPLQAVRGRPTLSEHAVLGELEVLPRSGLFRSTEAPPFLTDPVVLDAVGQLLGLWCLARDVYPFPIGIDKIELYGPTPPVGTRVPTHVEVTRRDARFVWADAEVQDGTGHVWMRIRGFRDWGFRWPPHNQAVRLRPRHHLLGRPSSRSDPRQPVIVEVGEDDLRDTDLDHMARLYLSMDEMANFREHEDDERRATEWLLGRIAAKDAVRHLLAQEAGSETWLHPCSFAVAADDTGAPRITGLEGTAPRVSITHRDGRAVAAAARQPVGVDFDLLEARGQGFVHLITDEAERALLTDAFEAAAERMTRAWCAKEAAGKALGVGGSDAPRDLVITSATAAGEFDVEHVPSRRRLRVRTEGAWGGILAIAVPADPPDDTKLSRPRGTARAPDDAAP